MDQLFLNSIGFPVRSGTLSRYRDESGVLCWSIEIECGESPQLDYRNWPDDRDEDELDWLAGLEPMLYAQMLPLPAASPDELVGRTFSFPQTPNDETAPWDRGVGWLFFCLYTCEHDLAYPMTVTFTERREQRYHVEIGGFYPVGERRYDLRVETWLDWVEEPRGDWEVRRWRHSSQNRFRPCAGMDTAGVERFSCPPGRASSRGAAPTAP